MPNSRVLRLARRLRLPVAETGQALQQLMNGQSEADVVRRMRMWAHEIKCEKHSESEAARRIEDQHY